MGRQVAQVGKVEHQFGHSCRRPIPAHGLLQAVGLRRDVVDHDDQRGLGIIGRGPPAILLVGPACVDRRLDRAAGTCQWYKFRVDADPVVERVVRAGTEQFFESDHAGHAATSG